MIGEFDGRKKYLANIAGGVSEGDAVWHEKRREDRLRAQGVAVVRWTWDELMKRLDEVAERVRAARARRRPGHR